MVKNRKKLNRQACPPLRYGRRACKTFELDLTDYVTGDMTFLTKAGQKKLFTHLRKCPACQKQFWSWKETHAVLKGKEQSARPGFQKRLNALLKEIKQIPVIKRIPGEKVLNNEAEIGKAAGVVWHSLAKNGKVNIKLLSRKVKLPRAKFNRAIGWLAKENKVCLTKKKQTAYIYLAEAERRKYQARV